MSTTADNDTTEVAPHPGFDARWCGPVVLSVWLFTLGWLPVWSRNSSPVDPETGAHGGFSPWLMIAVGFAVALGGVWWARHSWPTVTHGESLREQGSLLAVLTGLGVNVWLVAAGYTSPWQQWPALLLGTAAFGVWWAILLTIAPRREADELARQSAQMASRDFADLRDLLNRSDCADVRIIEYRDTRAGFTALLGPDESYARLPTLDDVEKQLSGLRMNLAVYWRGREGVELADSDVRLEGLSVDRWNLHVSTKHVLRENVPFERSKGRRDFTMPVWLGLFEDGVDMAMRLLGKVMFVVGATGGGKSVIVNNIIARALESRSEDGRADALVHVVASEKLIPLVYPWLLPWLEGRRARPALDAVVGEDPQAVADYLLGLYYFVKGRNSRLSRKSKTIISGDVPALVVIIEEAKVFLNLDLHVPAPGGQADEWWPISKLAAETAALCRSAGVTMLLVSQSGLFDAFGKWGDEMVRHATVRAVTVTMTPSDGYNTLPALPNSVDTTQLKDNGMYLQTGIGEDSRAEPGKAAKIDEDDVPPVAYEFTDRQAELTGVDVTAFERGCGDGWYADRWNRNRLPELVEAAAVDDLAPGGQGFAWPPDDPNRVHGLPATLPLGGDAPWADDAPAHEPVETPREDEPVVRPEDADVNPDAHDWGAALRQWAPLPKQRPPSEPTTGDGPQSQYGELPGDADVAEIERLSAIIREDADRQIAERDRLAALPDVVLPEPLGAVVAYLDGLDVAGALPEWIATATLAAEVLGDERESAGLALGKALARIDASIRSEQTPRVVDQATGRKARGYLTATFYRAAVKIRDAQP